MARFDGRVAIVTGGARGMGASFVRQFVAEGARVVVADRLVPEGEALARELGEATTFVETDVTSPESWYQMVAAATERFALPDVLVNNAGILVNHHLEDATIDEYRRVTDVNQVGVFLGMKAVLPGMRALGRGSIVNVGSIGGLVASPWCVAYVASKWAVRGMTKAAAVELAPFGIRVNAVHPADVETPMTATQRANGDITTEGIALGRFGLPAEIGNAVLFLASDDASFVTGADLAVDGGFTAV